MPTIRNTWAARGFKITTGTWDWHKRNGYQGGEDYAVGPGVPALACAAGEAYVVNDGLNSVMIELDNGWIITQRELKSRHGSFPRHVEIDDQIGTTGNVRAGILRWPHIDITIDGVRRQFTKYVTKTTTSTASVGGITKLENIVAASVTGKAVFYDSKLKVGYLLDLTASPGVLVLGTSGSPEWKAISAGAKKTPLTTGEIRELVKAYGIAPFDPARIGNLPKGTVTV